MTQTQITPDRIKTIAREVRNAEADRLGSKLPNTTVLNAITRALGLGETFAAYAGAADAATEPNRPDGTTGSVPGAEGPAHRRIRFILDCDMPSMDYDGDEFAIETGTFGEFRAIFAGQDCEIDFEPAARGLAQISVVFPRAQPEDATAARLIADATGLLHRLCDEGRALPLLHALSWTSSADEPELGVDFQYFDDPGSLCTMSVKRADWMAAIAAGASEEVAMLALGYDCEISESRTDKDIRVLDIVESRVFFPG